MPKQITEYPLLPLLRKFISEASKGKHLPRTGKKITRGSVQNYRYLENLLANFSIEKKFPLRIKNVTLLKKGQFDEEKKYWKDFYFRFTNYLYDDLDHYDNYVGRTMKLLRSFFNYLNDEKGLSAGTFHRKFYAPSEEVAIHVVTNERLNYLIYNKEKEKALAGDLKLVKDVFVFGCSVALRYSDLMCLKKTNLEIINQRTYLNVLSKKTQTYTKVKLPGYAVEILSRYSKYSTHKLLPVFTKAYMNEKIKLVGEHYGFTEEIVRTRNKRGVPVKLFKDGKNKKAYRFCDVLTTHTMRRTAITTLLSVGMNEHAVRQISGHSPNSKEFFRYVSLAQTYIDNEIDKAHAKLAEKSLEFA